MQVMQQQVLLNESVFLIRYGDEKDDEHFITGNRSILIDRSFETRNKMQTIVNKMQVNAVFTKAKTKRSAFERRK